MNAAEQALRARLESEDFHQNFLVEAGAGAGKSYTICRRILCQLLAGWDPASIAAITFTEKATLELREKLDREALLFDKIQDTDLLSLTGKLHISTIHSFCQTALALFPLETGGDLQVLTDEREQASRFFRAWTARDPSGAVSALEAFGGRVGSLEDTFLAMVTAGHVPEAPDPAAAAARRLALDTLTAKAHKTLRDQVSSCQSGLSALPETLKQAAESPVLTAEQSAALRRALRKAWKQSSRPKRLDALLFTADPNIRAWLAEYIEASKKKNQKADPARLGQVPPVFAAMDRFREKLETDGTMEGLAEAERAAGYDLALEILVPALAEYRAERDRAGLVTFSGLLTRARDLVRDHSEARRLLHERYRVFYVDEFQDTDPVQAELLFLITAQNGAERDWTRCRPAPGSLFLVGDPKQAIYRFRGADLDVYKRVKALFTEGPAPVGEAVTLRANFRSVPRICSFADRVFAPRDILGEILTPEEQAENRANPEMTGLLDDGLCQAGYVPMEAQQEDPGWEAVFSYPTRVLPNETDDADRVARFIQSAAAGNLTLPDRQGNPTVIRYGDFLILTRKKDSAGRYLEALSSLGIPVSFNGGRSLAEDPPLRRLSAWLAWLLEPDSEIALIRLLRECFGLEELGSVRCLKDAARCSLTRLTWWTEGRQSVSDPSLSPLLDALASAGEVLEDSRALTPMAFLEKLAEERLLGDLNASTVQDRERLYGGVHQVLDQLRRRPERGFSALARAALALCGTTLERELPLEPRPDDVRVMNLHKAKGLEGRIVILAADTFRILTPGRAGDVVPILRGSFGNASVLYAPKDWKSRERLERCYLEAEQVRLNYVAATRAEQLLLIAGGLVGKQGVSCWQAMADQAAPALAQDPEWGDFFAPLLTPQAKAQPSSAASKTSPAPPPDLTMLREGRIRAQSVPDTLHASPSTLDKSRPVLPDPETGDTLEDGPILAAGGAHGADWGTAVHRAMELCVSRDALDAEPARPLIRQALEETVPPLSRMTGTQRALLFGGELPESDEAGARYLAERLEEAVSFWFDGASPLRRLAAGGICRCELPFQLLLKREDALWPFLRDRLGDLEGQEDFQGSISVSGILDLAVLTQAGWEIIDYKTDRPRPGEGKESYRARLAGEYGAQLTAYREILARLSGRKVLGTRLCAVPLGGELIEIP